MGLLKVSDLQFEYTKSTKYNHDDPKVTGEPDSTLLSRTELWEVLYFINKRISDWNFKNISSGHKIESMIHGAPKDKNTHKEMTQWINENWKTWKPN